MIKKHPLSKLHQNGFSVVEVLIVIVVIAVVAAASFVAYTGLTAQARATAAEKATKTAQEEIQAYAALNHERYPTGLAVIDVTNTSDEKYQYSFDNAAEPKSFCVTATYKGTSYHATSTQRDAISGTCPGHI